MGKSSQSAWSSDGASLPEIKPHTKAKHKILEEYVENLIATLYGKGRYGEQKFTFIDGFAAAVCIVTPPPRNYGKGLQSEL